MALDPLPIRHDSRDPIHRDIAEDVRMPPDQLVRDAPGYRGQIEVTGLRGDLGVEDHL